MLKKSKKSEKLTTATITVAALDALNSIAEKKKIKKFIYLSDLIIREEKKLKE